MRTFEVHVPFIGYCSVLVPAESAEKAMAHAMRLNAYELMNSNDNSGGIGEIHFKLSVESGDQRFTVSAEEAESPDDLCSLEVLFNGKPERIGEISRRNIHVIEADPRYVIVGKPVNLGYGAAKSRECEIWGAE